MRGLGSRGRYLAWALFAAAALSLEGCGRGTKEAAESSRTSPWVSPGQAEEDGLQRARSGAVWVSAGGLSGRGVVYQDTGDGLVILTAGHVMADGAEGITVRFGDGREAVCGDYRIHWEADCAFLTLEREALGEDYGERYAAAARDGEALDGPEPGDGIFVADPENENGFGYRFAVLLESWIFVEDFGQYMMILSGEADPGMSGSGVYDEFGHFMGILCGVGEDGELAVLPSSVAEAMYGLSG